MGRGNLGGRGGGFFLSLLFAFRFVLFCFLPSCFALFCFVFGGLFYIEILFKIIKKGAML